MKKLLLLSVAVATVFAASAQVAKHADKDVEANATKALLYGYEDQVALLPAATVEPMAKMTALDKLQPLSNSRADGDDETDFTPVPCYKLPAGGFFNSWLIYDEGMNWDKWGYTNTSKKYLTFVPGDQVLTWTNMCGYIGTLPSSFSIKWTYPTLVPNENGMGVEYSESNTNNLTTQGYAPYYVGFSAPYIQFEDSTYQADRQMYVSGHMEWNFTNSGKGHYGLTKQNLCYSCAAADLNTKILNSWMGNYTNWTLGKKFRYTDTRLAGMCHDIEKPAGDAVLGIKSVTVAGWVNAASSGKLCIDIYEKIFTEDPENPGYGDFSLGERLGGGYVNATDLEVSSGTQFITIPILEVDGDFESASFVNVDRDVYVVLSSTDTENMIFNGRPYFMGSQARWINYAWDLLDIYEESEKDSGNYDVYTGEQIIVRSSGSNWGFVTGGAKVCNFCMFYDGCYTTLDLLSNEGIAEYVAPAEGGSQAFTFEPYYDLAEDGKFTGEGVNDWVLVYAEDYDETNYTQDVTIEVDPLPAGTVGRATVVTVAQPGSQKQIIVKQGDTSGIDSIEGDANVVSSQIFDLQGRQLNAVPESGLYIRRDVKADNTVATSKVVK